MIFSRVDTSLPIPVISSLSLCLIQIELVMFITVLLVEWRAVRHAGSKAILRL
jgi:hypothetical protein